MHLCNIIRSVFPMAMVIATIKRQRGKKPDVERMFQGSHGSIGKQSLMVCFGKSTNTVALRLWCIL